MSKDQRVKYSIFTSARKIVREVSANLDMDFESDTLDLIAEMVWRKLQLYGSDLEAFQKHAKRSSITPDDVKLLVRRNDSLINMVQSKVQIMQPSKTTNPALKKKRKIDSVLS